MHQARAQGTEVKVAYVFSNFVFIKKRNICVILYKASFRYFFFFTIALRVVNWLALYTRNILLWLDYWWYSSGRSRFFCLVVTISSLSVGCLFWDCYWFSDWESNINIGFFTKAIKYSNALRFKRISCKEVEYHISTYFSGFVVKNVNWEFSFWTTYKGTIKRAKLVTSTKI